jgi:hypothetical protein
MEAYESKATSSGKANPHARSLLDFPERFICLERHPIPYRNTKGRLQDFEPLSPGTVG